MERGRDWMGKLPGRWSATPHNAASLRSKHTQERLKRRAHGIPTHAQMQKKKSLTSRKRWCSLTLTLLNCIKLHLTTASLSGGWVPETSRSSHWWQPVPRWRLLPWLENPGQRQAGGPPSWAQSAQRNEAQDKGRSWPLEKLPRSEGTH